MKISCRFYIQEAETPPDFYISCGDFQNKTSSSSSSGPVGPAFCSGSDFDPFGDQTVPLLAEWTSGLTRGGAATGSVLSDLQGWTQNQNQIRSNVHIQFLRQIQQNRGRRSEGLLRNDPELLTFSSCTSPHRPTGSESFGSGQQNRQIRF